jgi:amidophosphoribosyltransferase
MPVESPRQSNLSVDASGKRPTSREQREAREVQAECGLFAVYLKDRVESTELTGTLYAGLLAVQHRAEGAAGMVISDGLRFDSRKGFGQIPVAFQQGSDLPFLDTNEGRDAGVNIGISHSRYPTSGRSESPNNIQPLNRGDIWMGHHGNFTNVSRLQAEHDIEIGPDDPDSDSGIVLGLIAKTSGETLVDRFMAARKEMEGGFSIAITDGRQMVFSRDGHGLRPAWLAAVTKDGSLKGWAYSVEDGAFKALNNESQRNGGYHFDTVRELELGETLVVDEQGLRQVEVSPEDETRCIFEMLYMQHPDSTYTGEVNIYEARRKSGHLLWQEAPVDLPEGERLTIMPVPDASRPAATGYYHEALSQIGDGAIWEEGVMANKYYGRKFIKSQKQRSADKFFVIPSVLAGKNVVLIDDSLVRGDTMRELVRKVRGAGAKSVHVRVASPEIVNPCPFGVALNDKDELLAHTQPDMKERTEYLGVDSLQYLSVEGLVGASGIPAERQCLHCLGGRAPNINTSGVIILNERKE